MRKTNLLITILAILVCATPVFAIEIIDPLGIGPGPDGFKTLLGRITTGISGLIATLAGIMIIVAGVLYLTSAGDPTKINTAKTALKYAIIGIVIAIIASPIVDAILEILKP